MEIGTTFGAIIDQLQQPVTGSVRQSAPPAIVKPTNDRQCAMLRQWAESTPPSPPVLATADELLDCIEEMKANLPMQRMDDRSGQIKANTLASVLSEYTGEALAFLTCQAIRRLRWFPSVRDCLDILAEYRRPEPDQQVALRLCQEYQTEQFDRWFASLRAGREVGDVPDQWKRIAIERGALRRLADGSIVIRATYYGPFKSYQAAEAKAA